MSPVAELLQNMRTAKRGAAFQFMRRMTAGENNTKKVVVSFQRKNNKIDVVIRDEGPGFNWQPFMEIEPSRATQSNGRGIAKAALLSFDRVEFIGSGNTVKVTTALRNG